MTLMNEFSLILSSDSDPLNIGPTWNEDMEIPATAEDLSNAIKVLMKKYRIDDFEEEFADLAKSLGASDQTMKRGEYNPLVLLEEGRKDDYKRFMKGLENLDKKYDFQEFHDQCIHLRSEFDRERKGYLYDNILLGCAPMAFFFPPAIADQFFLEWLDGVVEQEFVKRQKSVLLEYEDLKGETIRLVVRHKEDEFTEEYIDCRPIDRLVGELPYDSFVVRHFWNEELGWVPVPIHLIKTYAVRQ